MTYTCTAIIMRAPSSEFVSSSIPSWQILTVHAQLFWGARDLAFYLKVPLDSLLVWASSGGSSGGSVRMRRLAWTFAARIGDKYQIRLTRSMCYLCNSFRLIYEPPYHRTNKITVHPAKTQISLSICPVWSESSLCAEWVAKDPSFLHGDSEDWSDWADAEADLSLRWAHMPICWFCHEATHIRNLCPSQGIVSIIFQ